MSAIAWVPTASRSPLRRIQRVADQEAEAAPGAQEGVETFADQPVVLGRRRGRDRR